jgi:hypothetical protein
MSPDERVVFALAAPALGPDAFRYCATRVVRFGEQHYGALHLDSDKRDFVREARDEYADAVFYLGASYVRRPTVGKRLALWLTCVLLRWAMKGAD